MTADVSSLPGFSLDDVEESVRNASRCLLKRQAQDGHWVFELEADATIPAEYIMLNHYLGTIDDATEQKLAVYLREIQGEDGGWPLYHKGEANISASVKAYYALKMVGDDINAPHMQKAREKILELGGAEKSNVFTRMALALFEQVPWKACPVMRVEAVLLPKWFFFHMDKVSYWSRTVMVPLLVLAALKPRARNPRKVDIQELFRESPAQVKKWHFNATGHWLAEIFLILDRIAKVFEPLFPKFLTNIAVEKAMRFVKERLNGEDGLGAIFPAMANSVMAFDALGVNPNDPDYKIARYSIEKLLALKEDKGYCQPCLSPIWDTGLAAHALLEAGVEGDSPEMAKASQWLVERQILDVKGDWASRRPNLRPGGWAFQYRNDYYPDVDDTSVVGLALDRAGRGQYKEAIERAAEWIIGMQSKNGGWAAFDADNLHFHLNHIPFADHGALLDPPTEDVSARCISFLAQIGYDKSHPVMASGIEYLKQTQQPDGSWFGRWGTNYIYGTWSSLCALNAAGEDMNAPYIQKAVKWLQERQREDGGWGEDCATYWEERRYEAHESTPSQTAWAVMGLMAAGLVDSSEVARGIEYLLKAPQKDGKWDEERYNAVGFPRIFYLRYHGYSAYFPLWALARYRNLRRANLKHPAYGM